MQNKETGGDVQPRGILVECLRRLGPAHQFECGVCFFLYVSAIAATGTGLYRLCLGRPDAVTVVLVSLALWANVIAGIVLAVLLDMRDWTDELRDEVRRLHAQGGNVPGREVHCGHAMPN